MGKRKEKCKELMIKFFGPVSVRLVEGMSEEECVLACRKKVEGFFGEKLAKEFDNI